MDVWVYSFSFDARDKHHVFTPTRAEPPDDPKTGSSKCLVCMLSFGSVTHKKGLFENVFKKCLFSGAFATGATTIVHYKTFDEKMPPKNTISRKSIIFSLVNKGAQPGKFLAT